jgi:hypothetical protein
MELENASFWLTFASSRKAVDLIDKIKSRSLYEEWRIVTINTLFEKFSPHLNSVVIWLGCTGPVGQAKRVQDHLGVPVLDPVLIGLKMAEFNATLWKK